MTAPDKATAARQTEWNQHKPEDAKLIAEAWKVHGNGTPEQVLAVAYLALLAAQPDDAAAGPLPCPFCGAAVDPEGWLRNDGKRGPECNGCGATAESLEAWNKRDERYRFVHPITGSDEG